jgi:beta-1,4-N-acetylglucosaminyltransferase
MAAADSKPAVLLVCSHGGHLTEMLDLLPAFEGFTPCYFSYDAETTRSLNPSVLVPNRPYNPVRFVANVVLAWRFISMHRPAAVISTGAEIALPVFAVAKLRRIPTVYIECGAQVRTPSLTGRILSRVADAFFVQWPELLEYYGTRGRYAGSLIDETRPSTASANTEETGHA